MRTARAHLGYLVSQYPAVNHTFILREIRILRSLGFDVHVVSIRQPDRRPEALSGEEAEECALTRFVLGSGALSIAGAIAGEFLRRPARFLATFAFAIGLGGWDLQAAARHAFYFLEAVVAGRLFLAQGVRHAHTHFSSTVMLLVSRLFPVTFSMTIHGPEEFDDVAAFHLREKVAAARFVAAISHYAASQVMRASDPADWVKVRPLPLGVDPDAFLPRAVPARFEALSVARLAPVKAHLVLIGAIDRLVRAGRDIRLELVGGGPSRAAIEKEIARRGLDAHIGVRGALNHDQVIDYYRRAAVFTLASFAEGVPVVLMEAMAMEIPCVATWIAGVPELIRDGLDGLLVAPADEEALAGAIARLMDDAELRAQLGRSARERVMEKYNLARNVEALAAVFREHAP